MFTNTVKAEWLEDSPRDMRILEDISFFDSNGVEWLTPYGAIINGSSIPRAFWSILGSPYVGNHRMASVPHDYGYQTREREKDVTDEMYYDALIFKGVPHIKAHAMLLALQSTGSTWAEYDATEELPEDYD